MRSSTNWLDPQYIWADNTAHSPPQMFEDEAMEMTESEGTLDYQSLIDDPRLFAIGT